MTAEIGLFYGSSTCYTEIAAEKICQRLGAARVDIFNIADTPVEYLENYRYLILGIPTWDYGELQEDWEAVWDDLDTLDLSGTTVALYGLGDQEGYPEWFQDALGYLWAKVVNQGATCVGLWPVAGYRFEESKALTADGSHFVGLALDEETEFELSETRLAQWCDQVLAEFGLTA
ncbi:MAG: flavodoxin FldB [Porticoccaceae bacterium]